MAKYRLMLVLTVACMAMAGQAGERLRPAAKNLRTRSLGADGAVLSSRSVTGAPECMRACHS